MVPVCFPSKISSTTGLREAVVFALSSVTGLVRWTDYIPVKLVASADAALEGRTDAGGFIPMDMLSSNTGLMGWVDYLPVYVDNSATDAWAITATGFIPYAASGGGASIPDFYLNLSNPVNVTLGTTQARGSLLVGGGGGGGVITVDVQAARLTGVAPLYVNFDATGTTSSATSNPNQDIFYAWDFGDTGAGTWANGVQATGLNDKNTDFGVIGGHVFETAGTYTVTMACTDGTNTGSTTKTITVTNPDTVYSGTNTICVSQTTDTTGAPSGATLLTSQSASSIYSIFEANKGTNKRIMLRAGQNWTTNNTLSWAHSGMTLTKFGSGATPKIVVNAATCVSFAGGLDEIRLFDVDFEIDAAFSTSTNGIVTNGVLTKALWMRVNVNRTGGGTAFLMNPGNGIDGHLSFDQCAIVECSTTNRVDFGVSGMSAFVSVVRGSIIGNSFDNASSGEQVLRIPHLLKSTANHNSVARSNLSKAVFRVHGFNKDSWDVPSEKFVVSNNVFDNRGGINDITNLCEFGAADGINREGTGAGIFENNIGYSKVDSTTGQTMFGISSPGCVIRNNLFNATVGTPSTSYKSAVFLGTNSGIVGVQTTGVRVYNNTMFTNAFPKQLNGDGGHEYVAIVVIGDRGDLSTTYGTIAVKNNLHYSTTATINSANGYSVVNGSATATVDSATNTADLRTNPNFTATPPVAYSDWKPTSGYAVNGGTSVPVVKDFLNATRTGTFDIGAIQP